MESRPGEGSRFSFEIPLPANEGGTSRVAEVEDVSSLPEGIRVLIAEDNAVNRRVIESMVARPGIRVDVAENGRIALERHRTMPYDIILMDCQMPEMDGYEATGLIRALPGRLSVTPILGVTANAFDEDGERCRLAGMDGHVTKPLNREALLRAMAEAMSIRSLERACETAATCYTGENVTEVQKLHSALGDQSGRSLSPSARREPERTV